ncbi:hypothetical protein CYMTET_43864 [Cymbomonas tetramitiformis]|uniref:Tyrosine-specific transport protein n=1 Tax=Cymbomonas tetramitiformis TaxID=36881 RepID=A0AAE0C302_9CHLO|nr:hypothetical protein CYMTET_43864 [Cymbomonas tetramitiformis]
MCPLQVSSAQICGAPICLSKGNSSSKSTGENVLKAVEELISDQPYTDTLQVPKEKDFDFVSEESEVKSGTVLGAVALITGTTIGAGILALPAAVAPAGFGPSSTVLLAAWTLLLGEALLIAEVNVAIMEERKEYRREHGRPATQLTVGLAEMAGRTIGSEGQAAVTLGYLGTSGTLMVAYLAKSGEIFGQASQLSPETGAALFATVMGLVLYVGGTQAADVVNRFLTVALLALFAGIAVVGGGQADWSLLSYGDWGQASSTVPVIFLALVYHDLIPVLCSYLGGDLRDVRKSIILGSLPSLVMFLTWNAIALSVVSEHSGGSDPLKMLIENAGPSLSLAVQGFSGAAICTSFIGTALALSDFAETQLSTVVDKVGEKVEIPRPVYKWWNKDGVRATALVLSLVPPCAIACNNPDIFLGAANFAGAYGMTTLYGILPPVMAWNMRGYLADTYGPSQQRSTDSSQVDEPNSDPSLIDRLQELVPGGNPVLAGLALSAFAVQVMRASQDFGPQIHELPKLVMAAASGVLDAPIG